MAGSSDGEIELKRACCEDGQDRISSLPDEILIHILSLAPTEFSVRTSVLSPRWKSLWASVPALDFFSIKYRLKQRDIYSKVSNFIDKLLFHYKLPSIERFYLESGQDYNITRLNAWIEVIVRRGVQKMIICNYHNRGQRLSRDLFTCKTLVKLELLNFKLDVPDSVNLPCLKIFRVTLCNPSNDLTTRLFCSCPVLEKLYIAESQSTEILVFNISSPVLKTIDLRLSSDLNKSEYVVMIDAPVLENLSVYMHYNVQCIMKTQSPVLAAKLCGDGSSHPEFADSVLGLLKEIFFVKHLHLSSTTVAALNSFHLDHLPLFPHVTKLGVDVFSNTDCSILSAMLHLMPNLSTLILWRTPFCDRTGSRRRIYWTEPQSVPTCVQFCVVEVIVKGIEGCASELGLIKFFLKNAKKLSRVTLEFMMEAYPKLGKFQEKVAKIPRSSETCQVEAYPKLGKFQEKVAKIPRSSETCQVEAYPKLGKFQEKVAKIPRSSETCQVEWRLMSHRDFCWSLFNTLT